MKHEGSTPLPARQGLFCVFKSVRLFSYLISLITVCICFLGIGAFNQTLALTYYVDNNITDTFPANATPDCTNYNTSTFTCSGGSSSAYKTIADINAGSFSSDDQILFRKGQTWREQLTVPSSGTSGHPITFGAFGSGAKPVITGADVMNGFSDGGSNIWDKTGVTTQPYVVSFSGAVGTLASSRADCNAPGKWYWTGNTLSVYATSDPSGTIEAGQRNTDITLDGKSYITVDSLDLRYANADGMRIINAVVGVTVSNSDISYAYTDGIYSYTTGTTYRDTLLITANTVSYNGASGILLSDYTRNSTVSYNNIHHNSLIHAADGPHEYSGGIYVGLDNTSGIISEHNTIYNNGLTSGNDEGLGIWYDTVSTSNGSIIRYNQIYNNSDSGIRVEKSNDIQVYYNLSYSNEEGIRVHSSTNGKSCNNNLVYNNVFSLNNYGIFIRGVVGGNNLQNNVFKNNIVTGNTTRTLRAVVGGDNNGTTGSGNVYTYNSFGPESSNFIEWGLGVYKSTYDSWETAAGNCGSNGCSHSIEADPLFVGGTEAKPYPYFYLKSNSQAINAGTNVGLTSDYLGVSVPQGAAPDIGAFEYTVSIPENIWFLFPLFLAIPRLIFLLSNKQGQRLLFSMISRRKYKSLLRELYLPYLDVFGYRPQK